MDLAGSSFELPPALAVAPGGRCGFADRNGGRKLGAGEARPLFENGPTLVAHAGMTASRLALRPPPRSPRLLDVLELFAFVRPAQFCAPTPAGLALALALAEPRDLADQALALREVASRLLEELGHAPTPGRDEALAQAEALAGANWAWAPAVLGALRSRPGIRPWRGDGLDPWRSLAEWEEEAPAGEPGSEPIDPEAASARLSELLARSGLTEPRPMQARYAAEAAFAFQPRDNGPRMLLAEAGTGVGKTLGYLASASLWAEANGPGVWISTYTRALQRQIHRESQALAAQPDGRSPKVVVRKGRENYLCLLNFQDAANAARLGGGDLIGLALAARWIRASADGDMTGGDFPAWLPTLFAVGPAAQAGAANLVDRRGECLHAGCPHYRVCFVEKAVRSSRSAHLVIANHALVMSQAAFDGARSGPSDGETSRLTRIVFDEGHHLFDAADNAFSAVLSGAEAAEMRRWIRGPESRGRRGRGLEARLGELLVEREAARRFLDEAVRAAALLPGEGWSSRIAPPEVSARPTGPVEAFLAEILGQLRERAAPSDIGMECSARPSLALVRAAAAEAMGAIQAIERPLAALAKALADALDAEADTLGGAEPGRIEGALRGLERRAQMVLPAWRAMLQAIAEEGSDEERFVDWFDAAFLHGRVVDVAARRHHVDPTEPLAASVIAPAHGVLVTSATLTDTSQEDPFALSRLRTGAARLVGPVPSVSLPSPFDYGRNARAIVVTDIAREDPRQTAAALRELFAVAGGGGLGLFTAIRRLRAAHAHMVQPMADLGLALYAQHVDPLDAGTLVDIFRAEEDACLLGTDAVRDGVDVPGRALRLLAFDRIPWPRPDILHKARRERFGGKAYDDAIARGRIAQAFGRLIRRADDKGVFLMLDAAAPSRLFSGLPPAVTLERLGLVEALEAVKEHLAG